MSSKTSSVPTTAKTDITKGGSIPVSSSSQDKVLPKSVTQTQNAPNIPKVKALGENTTSSKSPKSAQHFTKTVSIVPIKENIPTPPAVSTDHKGVTGLPAKVDSSSSVRTKPPQVSQVSKLLAAISTWTSVPQQAGVQVNCSRESDDSRRDKQPCADIDAVSDGGSCDKEQGSHDQSCEEGGNGEETPAASDQEGKSQTSQDASLEGTSPPCDETLEGMRSPKGTCPPRGNTPEVSPEGTNSPVDKEDTQKTSPEVSKDEDTQKDKKTPPKPDEDSKKTSPEVTKPGEDTGEGEGMMLPPVDSVNVSRIQRTLFNTQLRRHLSSVCPALGLSLHQVLPQVNATTANFRYYHVPWN